MSIYILFNYSIFIHHNILFKSNPNIFFLFRCPDFHDIFIKLEVKYLHFLVYCPILNSKVIYNLLSRYICLKRLNLLINYPVFLIGSLLECSPFLSILTILDLVNCNWQELIFEFAFQVFFILYPKNHF